MNIDWTTAAIAAAVGYYAKGKVEDAKSSTKQAVSETAAAAAAAAARAAVSGQTQPAGNQPTGKAGH